MVEGYHYGGMEPRDTGPWAAPPFDRLRPVRELALGRDEGKPLGNHQSVAEVEALALPQGSVTCLPAP